MVRMTRRNDKPAATAKYPPRKHHTEETFEFYPVSEPFKTKEEVDAYLGVPLIRCLRCGKKMKMLPTHLVRCHGITAEDYKRMYGIPWGRGLVCPSSSKAMAKNVMRRMVDGDLPGLPPPGETPSWKLKPKRERSLTHANSSRANLAKANPDNFICTEEGVVLGKGKTDRHQKPIQRTCECGVVFEVKPLAKGKKIRCQACARSRRNAQKRLRRARQG